MPDVGQSRLHAKHQMIRNDLRAPARKHVIVPANGPALAHQAKVHRRPYQGPVKCQIHTYVADMIQHSTTHHLMQGHCACQVGRVVCLQGNLGLTFCRNTALKRTTHSRWLPLHSGGRCKRVWRRSFGGRWCLGISSMCCTPHRWPRCMHAQQLKFAPHIGKSTPLGMVCTMSTYRVLRSSGLTICVGAS